MVGDGKNINFWLDNWLSKLVVYTLNIPVHLYKFLNVSVADYIVDGRCEIPSILFEKFLPLLKKYLRLSYHLSVLQINLYGRGQILVSFHLRIFFFCISSF